jgi:ABC-type sugar transport system ATPase subunit
MAESLDGGDEVVLGFRPEAARLIPNGALAGEVYATDLHGGYALLHVKVGENEIVHIRSDRQTSYPIGTSVRFDFDDEMIRFFNPRTEAAVRWEVPR